MLICSWLCRATTFRLCKPCESSFFSCSSALFGAAVRLLFTDTSGTLMIYPLHPSANHMLTLSSCFQDLNFNDPHLVWFRCPPENDPYWHREAVGVAQQSGTWESMKSMGKLHGFQALRSLWQAALVVVIRRLPRGSLVFLGPFCTQVTCCWDPVICSNRPHMQCNMSMWRLDSWLSETSSASAKNSS